MADESPFFRNEEAARHAAGVGIFGKILGALGLDESGARAATSWGEALENTMRGPSLINMIADTGEAAQRLIDSPFLPSEDPQKALDALAVAGVAQTGAFAAAPFRPAGSLGAGGSGIAKPNLNQLGFYSQAEHAARNLIPMKKGNPQQWINALKKQGVKDAELEWTGFKDWIKDKKELTRDDVATFFTNNRVRLKRQTFDEEGYSENQIREMAYENALERLRYESDEAIDDRFEIRETDDPDFPFQLVERGGDTALDDYPTEAAARRAALDRLEREAADYAYETPLAELARDEEVTLEAQWNQPSYRHDPPGRDYVERLYILGDSGKKQEPYQSGHWEDIENVLAHTRGDTRNVYGGGTARFIDELQSDWSQQLRQYGERQPPEVVARIQAEFDAVSNELRNLGWRRVVNPYEEWDLWTVPADPQRATEADRLTALLGSLNRELGRRRFTGMREEAAEIERAVQETEAQLKALGSRRLAGEERQAFEARENDLLRRTAELKQQLEAARRGVPPSPFAKTSDWARMALQAELYDAARKGHSHLAWTPGRIQDERWDNPGLVPFYDKTIPDVVAKLMRQHDPEHPGVTEVPIGYPRPFVYDPYQRLAGSPTVPIEDQTWQNAASWLGGEIGQGYLPRFELRHPLSPEAEVTLAPFTGQGPSIHRQSGQPPTPAWFNDMRPAYSIVEPPRRSYHSPAYYGRFHDPEHAQRVMQEARHHFTSGAAEPERFPAVELTETFKRNLLDKGWPLFSAGPSPFISAQPQAGMGYLESDVPGTVLEEVY